MCPITSLWAGSPTYLRCATNPQHLILYFKLMKEKLENPDQKAKNEKDTRPPIYSFKIAFFLCNLSVVWWSLRERVHFNKKVHF